jgi:hypothetical protein
LADGAIHETVASPFPAVAETPGGDPGKPAGVSEVVLDADPEPSALTAVTVTEYEVPF